MKIRKTLTMLIGLAVLLAAAQTGRAADCLLTKPEAQKILGEEVAAPRTGLVRGMGAGLKCAYFTAAPLQKRGGVGSLTTVLYDPKTMRDEGIAFKDPVKFFEKMLAVKKKGANKIQEAPGLGDRAFWEPGADVLHVLTRGNYVTIQVRDLAKISAPNRGELSQKISAHRRALAEKAARDYILPRIKARN